jgi:hypothetical protein
MLRKAPQLGRRYYANMQTFTGRVPLERVIVSQSLVIDAPLVIGPHI